MIYILQTNFDCEGLVSPRSVCGNVFACASESLARLSPMHVLIAFDKWKECMSASAACAAAARGLARIPSPPTVDACPLADGGEGFVDALVAAARGRKVRVAIRGPRLALRQAHIGLLASGRSALVESAQACGLALLRPHARSPLTTTTYGVGQMMLAAARRGAEEICIGLGGTATTDAGMGMLAALGWRFYDRRGRELSPVGRSLGRVTRIKAGLLLSGMRLIAACDVDNPLYGPRGAARVYAPQKGATASEVVELEKGLRHFAAVAADLLGRDMAQHPGAGAAGGLGFALLAFLQARFCAGAKMALQLVDFRRRLAKADLCLTGEGRTDRQTAYGKLPAAVAAACAQAGVPCLCLSGALAEGWGKLYASGFTSIASVMQKPCAMAEALAAAPRLLADAAENACRLALALRRR